MIAFLVCAQWIWNSTLPGCINRCREASFVCFVCRSLNYVFFKSSLSVSREVVLQKLQSLRIYFISPWIQCWVLGRFGFFLKYEYFCKYKQWFIFSRSCKVTKQKKSLNHTNVPASSELMAQLNLLIVDSAVSQTTVCVQTPFAFSWSIFLPCYCVWVDVCRSFAYINACRATVGRLVEKSFYSIASTIVVPKG